MRMNEFYSAEDIKETISAIGKTMPPQAARLTRGSANRATMAFIIGPSVAIKIQLAANGHQVLAMRRIDKEVSWVVQGLLTVK